MTVTRRFDAYEQYPILGTVHRMHLRAEHYLSQIIAELLGSDQPCRHDKTSRDCDDLDCWNAGRLAAEVARLSRPLETGRDITGPEAATLAETLTALNNRYDRITYAVENHRAHLKHARGNTRRALTTSERKGPKPWK